MPSIEELERDLIAEGLLIEAGFRSLRAMSIPADVPQAQVDEMRSAFFAGAHHLFATIMRVLDPGDEPTQADMSRLSQIQAELDRFVSEFQARLIKTHGSA